MVVIQALVRIWRNWKTPKLLVELKNGTNTMVNDLVIPKTLNKEPAYDSTVLLLVIFPKVIKAFTCMKTCI